MEGGPDRILECGAPRRFRVALQRRSRLREQTSQPPNQSGAEPRTPNAREVRIPPTHLRGRGPDRILECGAPRRFRGGRSYNDAAGRGSRPAHPPNQSGAEPRTPKAPKKNASLATHLRGRGARPHFGVRRSAPLSSRSCQRRSRLREQTSQPPNQSGAERRTPNAREVRIPRNSPPWLGGPDRILECGAPRRFRVALQRRSRLREQTSQPPNQSGAERRTPNAREVRIPPTRRHGRGARPHFGVRRSAPLSSRSTTTQPAEGADQPTSEPKRGGAPHSKCTRGAHPSNSPSRKGARPHFGVRRSAPLSSRPITTQPG